jgi:carboxypeptidase C (cathepsin A)
MKLSNIFLIGLIGLTLMVWLATSPPLMRPVAAGQNTPRSFVTKHTGGFNGQRINYLATVGETILQNETGTATASFVSISYVRADENDKARRPVIFAFNGGPGSSSVSLHMGALGPKRLVFPADLNAEIAPPYQLVDNHYALLDVADLVLIDPVETGYSRLLPGAKRESFFSAIGDAKAVAQFIQAWLKANGRESSPKYVVGESYGTIRAVLVAATTIWCAVTTPMFMWRNIWKKASRATSARMVTAAGMPCTPIKPRRWN